MVGRDGEWGRETTSVAPEGWQARRWLARRGAILGLALSYAATGPACAVSTEPTDQANEEVGDDAEAPDLKLPLPDAEAPQEYEGALGFYIERVHPIFLTKPKEAAACASCHIAGVAEPDAPVLFAEDPVEAYELLEDSGLITIPENSLLITYGPHAMEPWLAHEESQVIAVWLQLEAIERGLVVAPPTTPGSPGGF